METTQLFFIRILLGGGENCPEKPENSLPAATVCRRNQVGGIEKSTDLASPLMECFLYFPFKKRKQYNGDTLPVCRAPSFGVGRAGLYSRENRSPR